MVIPYVGTVLLLPLGVFNRAYSLHYLAQYGPEFDVFAGSADLRSGEAPEAASS